MTNALATVEQREAHPIVVGIQSRMPAIRSMLPPGMDEQRFMAVTIQAIVKNPDILSCTPESVITAIVEAAQDGLEPTGARGGAHLVKFGSEAVLIRDYRGVIRIIIESGAASRVDARAVHRDDEFALDYASPDPVIHRPAIPATGDVIGYYALFWLPDGTKQAEFMSVDEIQKVRGKSRGKDSMGWTEFFDQMARKTVIKRGANYLNLRPDIRERLMREDSAEYEGQVVSVQRDERLAASRSQIHDRAARLTGGAAHPEQPAEASTTSEGTEARPVRGASAGTCPHDPNHHRATDAGLECGDCGELLARRDQPEPGEAGPPASQAPVQQPTTMPDAQSRVARLAIEHRLVTQMQSDDDWARFDEVMASHGVEPPPLETSPEAIAEWNALGDRIGRGEFDAPSAGDDPMGKCQEHDLPWKFVPAGHNRAGKPFRSFWTCAERDCSNKPTKAWRDRQPEKAGQEPVPA